MGSTKFYAVRVGHTPGIYETWDDCKAQVSGFPGAKFKSFSSLEAAEVWYADKTHSQTGSSVDYNQQCAERTQAFIEYLQKHGIPAYEVLVKSKSYKRIGIENGGGTMDLYYTKKLPNDLRIGNIAVKMKKQILYLWETFLVQDIDAIDNKKRDTAWDTVDHFYNILYPYRSLTFDYIEFARALQQASHQAPAPNQVRFDFDTIAKAYRELRPSNDE